MKTSWGLPGGDAWRGTPPTHRRAAMILSMPGAVEGRRALLATLLAGVFTAAPRQSAALDPDGEFQRAGDLAVYLELVPANITEHPPEHTGRGLHGTAPRGRDVHHLLVGLFDTRTGARITQASVTAVVHGNRGRPAARVKLAPMTVSGAEAYGGFVRLPPRDFYHIEIEVLRPEGAAVRAVFRHQHLQP